MSLVDKAKEINLVLSEPEVNLWKLRELALSDGGLVTGTPQDGRDNGIFGVFPKLSRSRYTSKACLAQACWNPRITVSD